jgi:iron transport multicopper oxidase
MLIVRIDGVPTRPTSADTISVSCGQRYDVILFGKQKPKRNYAFVSYQPDKHEEVVGELRYSDQFDRPVPWVWTEPPIDDMSIKPLNRQPALLSVDRKIVLPVYMTRQRRIFIGSYSYVTPHVPTLFTALSTGKLASNPAVYGHGVNPVVVEYGDVVQIEVSNSDPIPRPVIRLKSIDTHEFWLTVG